MWLAISLSDSPSGMVTRFHPRVSWLKSIESAMPEIWKVCSDGLLTQNPIEEERAESSSREVWWRCKFGLSVVMSLEEELIKNEISDWLSVWAMGVSSVKLRLIKFHPRCSW